ncbi:SO_0444 family Cu/Zn efflux transporter [Desulfatibacillum aliphaticivorans]|uniref:SO_0444 family Cu/Zn efflux transporter n=1 Tax=Desulfatibacillum aliphaticivorans TaxID=218208 RepID=UPI00041A4E20|nr:SO_0444 family Cu/Zn efflux transporter [Desulfatibacillum aliphaticivorans]
MDYLIEVFRQSVGLLFASAPYIIFGLVVSGLLRVFLNPNLVSRHLGHGRFSSVFKAAFWGIPIPLCSCSVLPAAVTLKKQGANNGATTAFLISTPESGVDSIAVSWALLDPIMAVARPVAAFAAASAAGIAENLFGSSRVEQPAKPDLSCPVDGCCSGEDCSPEEHRKHHTLLEKLRTGVKFAFGEVWGDMVGWFFVGLIIAGLVVALLPPDILGKYLGGGIGSMLIMLAAGIPIYICATASTPIAAALILQGVSPGAALVFLLAGPATNITSLTVLFGVLGKRAAAIYLSVIALSAVVFGLAVDAIYAALGLSGTALLGKAAEAFPPWIGWVSAGALVLFSVKPLSAAIKAKFSKDSGEGSCSCHGCCSDHAMNPIMDHMPKDPH